MLGTVVVLLVLTWVILIRIPSGKYLQLVDTAHPVAPLVQVQGARPAESGTLYFVDVTEQKASEFDVLFPWLHPHSSLKPAANFVPPCSTAAEAEAVALEEMATSQKIAAVVALRHLGYHVDVRPAKVIVSYTYPKTNASCNLQPTDVLLSANGIPTPTVTALHSALGRLKPGDVVNLRVRRGTKTMTVPIRTVPTPGDPTRPFIGIAADQTLKIKLPIKVTIDASGIGGPSAGLAFALEVMQQLGHNVLHGHKVAATGEIFLNGAVGSIGGIKQKTYGVRQAGADVFLVPAGQNARDARKYAGPLRIIPVRTFDQALHALATLPRKP